MLGLEGGGLEAVDGRGVVIEGHHDDQATLLPQHVLHDGHSIIWPLLVVDHHVASGKTVIGDECEMARLSLRAEQ